MQVTIHGVEIIRKSASGKAVLAAMPAVHVSGSEGSRRVWLPLSQITIDGDTVTMPSWLFSKKSAEVGMDGYQRTGWQLAILPAAEEVR